MYAPADRRRCNHAQGPQPGMAVQVETRGLHSPTFQLILSRFCDRQTGATRHIPQNVLKQS